MSEETDSLFEALFALEDVRELLRETAPSHKLDPAQKRRLADAIAKVRSSLARLEAKL